MSNSASKQKTGFWDSFILIMIVLVIVQTFLEEFSVVNGMSLSFRHLLVFSGLFFDLVFTIEYLIKQIRAALRHRGLDYLLHQRGWIDLLSSVPLLLLNSAPRTIILLAPENPEMLLFSGLDIANLMKVVKAVRITRILRFIRMIKLFGKIHNAESTMAQRHIARIATLSVSMILLVLISGNLIHGGSPVERAIEQRSRAYRVQLDRLARVASDELIRPKMAAELFRNNPDFIALEVFKTGSFLGKVNRVDFLNKYDIQDYTTVSTSMYKIHISLLDERQQEAWQNLLYLIIIIVLVVALMTFYSKHFVQTVTDVVHVMKRGMSEPDYNLQVKILERYSGDEIFELAQLYNEQWLPVKDRYRPLGNAEPEPAAPLTLEQFFGKQQ